MSFLVTWTKPTKGMGSTPWSPHSPTSEQEYASFLWKTSPNMGIYPRVNHGKPQNKIDGKPMVSCSEHDLEMVEVFHINGDIMGYQSSQFQT